MSRVYCSGYCPGLRCLKTVFSLHSSHRGLATGLALTATVPSPAHNVAHNVGGLALWQRRSSCERSCSTLSPVSAGMGDRLRAGIPPRYVTKPTRSTQPCIPLGSLNRVPALIGWGNGGNVTSAGWQVTLCDPIRHVSSRSGVVLVAQTAIRFLTLPYMFHDEKQQH